MRPRDLPATLQRGSAAPQQPLDASDAASLRGADTPAATLQRCRSCMSKLGAMSRSSTAATPADLFSPAWTIEPVAGADPPCPCRPAPARPPKPPHLQPGREPAALLPGPTPTRSCSCSRLAARDDAVSAKVGPYENYDVPKPSTEVNINRPTIIKYLWHYF